MVDGTGADRFHADVAIDGEHIVAVSGPDDDPMGRVIRRSQPTGSS